PFKGDLILTNEKVFLLTNDEIKMPNIIGWSLRDVNKLAYILNLNLKVEGSGYVKKQSIKEGEIVNSSDELIVILD
ncbi:MAG TPA: PASTA domain-containing protein, partial [Tenericutes bacterium]|nr:PASTA domain-containing protein [Mycoplasmatota bacterium]